MVGVPLQGERSYSTPGPRALPSSTMDQAFGLNTPGDGTAAHSWIPKEMSAFTEPLTL